MTRSKTSKRPATQSATVGQLKRSFRNRTERNKRSIAALERRLSARINELEQFIVDMYGIKPRHDIAVNSVKRDEFVQTRMEDFLKGSFQCRSVRKDD